MPKEIERLETPQQRLARIQGLAEQGLMYPEVLKSFTRQNRDQEVIHELLDQWASRFGAAFVGEPRFRGVNQQRHI
jgi:hypothetical protein